MKYKKIMIVDDSVTSRMIIKRCFEIAGFDESEFIEAEDGLAALAMVEKEEVDLIVSDLNMPKLGGADLIRRLNIKEETKNIPVIIVSSLQGEKIIEEVGNLPIKGTIKKPLSPAEINDIFVGEL